MIVMSIIVVNRTCEHRSLETKYGKIQERVPNYKGWNRIFEEHAEPPIFFQHVTVELLMLEITKNELKNNVGMH